MTTLTVPRETSHAIVGEVRRYGAKDVETGGFLLAPRGSEAITTVAFAGVKGIVRHRLYFEISEIALDRLFGFAEDAGCSIPAQFHSHAGLAFLSRTDREHGLRVPDFISAVIPDFTAPPEEMSAWTWWRFNHGDWHATNSPRTTNGDLHLIIFDEDGIRES